MIELILIPLLILIFAIGFIIASQFDKFLQKNGKKGSKQPQNDNHDKKR